MIKAEHITKTYNPRTRKAQTVLLDASLELPDKGLVAIVGPSGSGKSTILNAVGGLISYDGKILYDGHEAEIEKYRRENIGYIFQDFLIFDSLSIRDNIRIGLQLSGIYSEEEISKRVDVLLKAVSLKVNSRRSAGALSSGQKQRVAIARALANNPRILLADEPTGNLDSENSVRIMKILKRLSRDRLVVLVTHNENLVHLYADEAFRIEEKKFREFPPEECPLDEAYAELDRSLSLPGEEKESVLSSGEKKETEWKKEELVSSALNVTLYSKGPSSRKVTLVEKDGKLYVLGENVSLVREEDLNGLLKEDQKESGDTEKAEGREEPAPAPLDFTRAKEKRPWKENPFFLSLAGKNPFNGSSYKGKKGARWMEILLSLILFVILNVGVISIQQDMASLKSLPNEQNAVMLRLTDKKRKELFSDENGTHRLTLSTQDILDDVKNEDSALIGGRSLVYQIMSDTYRMNGGYIYGNKRDYAHVNVFPAMTFVSRYGEATWLSEDTTDTNAGFLPIGEYSSVYPELKRYGELKDDEIVVDEETLDLYNLKFGDPDEAIGAKIYIEKRTHDLYRTNDFEYTVKAVSHTGIPAIYASDATALRYTVRSFNTHTIQGNAYSYSATVDYFDKTHLSDSDAYFPSFKGYKFVRYEDAVSSDEYNFSGFSGSYDNPLTGQESGDDFITGYPVAVISDSVRNSWEAGSVDMNEKDYLFSGCFYAPKEAAVTYKSDPDAKVMAFYPVRPEKGNNIDSFAEFYRWIVLEKVEHNIEISDDYKEEGMNDHSVTLHLPTGLTDTFKGVSFQPGEGEFSPIYNYTNRNSDKTPYTNEWSPAYTKEWKEGEPYVGDIDGKVKMSRASFLNLLGSMFPNPEEITMTAGSSASDTALHDYENGTCFLLSKDPQKTVQYYQNKGAGYEAMTIHDAKRLASSSKMMHSALPYIITIASMFAVFLLFTILNGVGRVNSIRYSVGVLRCLGASKGSVIEEEIGYASADYLLYMLIPNLILYLLMSFVSLAGLGWFLPVYLLAHYLIVLISSLIPLSAMLRKKPAGILRSLN